MFSNPIVGGTVLIRPAIQSPDYVAGTSGWSINKDGTAEFNDVTVRGEVHVGTGQDFIDLNPGPPPSITISTSNPDQVHPSFVGYNNLGSNTLNVNGPDFGQGADFIAFQADPSIQVMEIGFWDQLVIDRQDLSTSITMDTDIQVKGPVNFITGPVSVNSVDQGMGVVGSASLTTNVTFAATETVIMSTGSMTFKNGRAYRVSIWGLHQWPTTDNYALYQLRKGTTTAGTLYKGQMRTRGVPVAATNGPVNLTFTLTNTSGADVTTAVSLTGIQGSVAQTWTFTASAGNVASIIVEDIGLASSYPGNAIT